MATILIVDTNPTDRRAYITLLGNFGHRLLEAKDGMQALDTARIELPDLIITDIIMPNMDGFTLVRRLHIIRKPAEPQEILRAVNETLKRPAMPPTTRLPQTGQLQREHLQLLADKLYQKISELEKANEHLRNTSLNDGLTGLNNRRGFMILATGLLKFARRAGYPLCLIYIDLDSLKYINDTFGHVAGDTALIQFANILTDTFRDSDVIGRLGGDEFVVLIADASENDLASMQARLQSIVDAYNLQAGSSNALSFSLGVIRIDPISTNTMEELLSQADAAMYKHKQSRKRIT